MRRMHASVPWIHNTLSHRPGCSPCQTLESAKGSPIGTARAKVEAGQGAYIALALDWQKGQVAEAAHGGLTRGVVRDGCGAAMRTEGGDELEMMRCTLAVCGKGKSLCLSFEHICAFDAFLIVGAPHQMNVHIDHLHRQG